MNAATTTINGAAATPAEVVAATAKMAGRKSAKAPAGTVSMNIDPKLIKRREDWNTRFDFGELDLLAKSIEHELSINPHSGGLINDIRVERMAKQDAEGYEFELIDGDRRLSAIEILLKKGTKFPHGVSAKVEPHHADADAASDRDQLVRMFTANTGKAFLPMEEAITFGRMKAAGMSHKEIISATGRSHGVVTRAFLLLKADGRLKKAVEDKQIKAQAAVDIMSASRGDPELLESLIEEALAAKTKTAKKAVTKKVKQAKVTKAKKEGRKLRIRALDDEQLSALGEQVSKLLQKDMKALGLAVDTKLTDWIKGCEADVKLGYQFGVLQGLLAAAGAPAALIAGE